MTAHSFNVVKNEQLQGWLLDGDPSIRWQVLRYLLDAPEEEWRRERSRVAREGWGARILSLQSEDGTWSGQVFFPNCWLGVMDTLQLLRDLGVNPDDQAVRTATGRIQEHCNWGEEWGFSPYFAGEVEPCINGRVLADGAYFGHPNEPLLQRLLSEQLEDGGWNCEAPTSCRSSFHSTICVLDGLLAFEKHIGAREQVTAARLRGQEYLLERSLFRRRSSGGVVCDEWLKFSFPVHWHYSVLRGLDFLRATGIERDPRLEEALQLVRSKRQPDGRWPLEHVHPGNRLFELEAAGKPSRWATLHALRVLRWFER